MDTRTPRMVAPARPYDVAAKRRLIMLLCLEALVISLLAFWLASRLLAQ